MCAGRSQSVGNELLFEFLRRGTIVRWEAHPLSVADGAGAGSFSDDIRPISSSDILNACA